MADARAKLESLLAGSSIGIGFLDRELRYVETNETLAELLGRPVGETSPAIVAQLRGVLETGEVLRDVPLERGDRAFLASYFPVRSAGAIVGIGVVVVDNTDRRRIETDLRRAVSTREDVLAVVSHDLRGPLATIELTASILGMHLGEGTRERKHLEIIHRSVSRMQHMIDDLLDSASIHAGRLSLQLAGECAEELVLEALDLQEAIAIERGILLKRTAATNGAKVQCDRLRILQVFGNLIGNSIKFCRPGDEILVSARHVGREVEFCVRDPGPGIEPEVLPTLFEPYRLPPSHAQAGSGLGLHICKGIVERHGGRIWADSAPGVGTTMSFTLPVTHTE